MGNRRYTNFISEEIVQESYKVDNHFVFIKTPKGYLQYEADVPLSIYAWGMINREIQNVSTGDNFNFDFGEVREGEMIARLGDSFVVVTREQQPNTKTGVYSETYHIYEKDGKITEIKGAFDKNLVEVTPDEYAKRAVVEVPNIGVAIDKTGNYVAVSAAKILGLDVANESIAWDINLGKYLLPKITPPIDLDNLPLVYSKLFETTWDKYDNTGYHREGMILVGGRLYIFPYHPNNSSPNQTELYNVFFIDNKGQLRISNIRLSSTPFFKN